jgi:hypothetical protein
VLEQVEVREDPMLLATPVTPNPFTVSILKYHLGKVAGAGPVVHRLLSGPIAPGQFAPALRDRLTEAFLATGGAAFEAEAATTALAALRDGGVAIPEALAQAVWGVGIMSGQLLRADGYLRGVVDAGRVPADTFMFGGIDTQVAETASRARAALAALTATGWKGAR